MGSPAIFNGARTKLLTSKGLLLQSGRTIDYDGEPNYIKSPNDATNWAQVGDLDVATTTTAADLPRENLIPSGVKITADANTQSTADYVYIDINLDDVDLNRVLKITWDQKITGSYVAGDLAVVITTQADRTTALYTPSVTAIPAADGTFGATFVPTDATTTLSLVIRSTTDMATNAGIVISNVVVGPGTLVQGAPVGDWTTFTPTGSWTTNVVYYGKKRRVGDTNEYSVDVDINGAVGGGPNLSINLPSGDVIDTAKLPLTPTAGTAKFGEGLIYDDSAGENYQVVIVHKSTADVYVAYLDDAAAGIRQGVLSTSLPVTPAAGDKIRVRFQLPIVGLSSGVYLGSGADGTSMLDWTSFTPTFQGFGTLGSNDARRCRVGQSMLVRGEAQTGTVTADEARIYLGYTLKNIGTKIVGRWWRNTGAASNKKTGTLWVDSTSSAGGYVKFGNDDNATASFPVSALVGNSLFNSSETFFYEIYSVPVDSWTSAEYLGKMLVGHAAAGVGRSGLVNNDASNTGGTPIKGRNDGSLHSTGYVGERITSTLVNGSVAATGSGFGTTVYRKVTLNKGIYLVSGTVSVGGYSGNGGRVTAFINGGTYFGRANGQEYILANIGFDVGASAFVLITADSTDVNLNVSADNGTMGGTATLTGEFDAIRIA